MKIYYFTGTGNSYWVAKKIGEYFSAEVCSIVDFRHENSVVADDDVIGIVCPTYMSDIPWIIKEFLLKLSSAAKPYTFAILTSNHGESGKGFANIDHALLSNGLTLSLAFDLQMPGNCIESTAEQDRERLAGAPAKVAGFCKSIENREKNFISDNTKAGGKFVEKSWFYSPYNIMKRFKIKKNCTGCGICAKICPTGNIDVPSGKAVHGRNCAACYACVHWCPEHSTIVNVPTFRSLRQYHHPEVALHSMLMETEA